MRGESRGMETHELPTSTASESLLTTLSLRDPDCCACQTAPRLASGQGSCERPALFRAQSSQHYVTPAAMSLRLSNVSPLRPCAGKSLPISFQLYVRR